ncbi:MAG: AAA family ATPase [Methanocalculaceae archaeon]|jgi:predicted AAA+ superfamily ATPase|nr:AAA family ATPase [Methanocalculaceae archaeon]
MNPLYPRERYLQKIRPHINKPIIKVLTGIRRSGKSALLTLTKNELISGGIRPDHIIRINFEDIAYDSLTSSQKLDQYLREKMVDDGKTMSCLTKFRN